MCRYSRHRTIENSTICTRNQYSNKLKTRRSLRILFPVPVQINRCPLFSRSSRRRSPRRMTAMCSRTLRDSSRSLMISSCSSETTTSLRPIIWPKRTSLKARRDLCRRTTTLRVLSQRVRTPEWMSRRLSNERLGKLGDRHLCPSGTTLWAWMKPGKFCIGTSMRSVAKSISLKFHGTKPRSSAVYLKITLLQMISSLRSLQKS